MHRLGLRAIVIGDKGLGRKELIIRLANQQHDEVLRVDADITVYPPDTPEGLLLDAALARQPWRGVVDWDRGDEGRLRCRLRTLRATLRFSRTGRKDDGQEAEGRLSYPGNNGDGAAHAQQRTVVGGIGRRFHNPLGHSILD